MDMTLCNIHQGDETGVLLRLDDYLYMNGEVKLMAYLSIKNWNMLGILGNIKEYFWRSREHGVELLGTGELYKSEFKGTS